MSARMIRRRHEVQWDRPISDCVTQRQKFQSTSKKYGITSISIGKLNKLEYMVGPTMRRDGYAP
jgi:hypothetical protein